MIKIKIKGKIKNIFGEVKNVEAVFVPIRKVSPEELIQKAKERGMFYPTPPKPSVAYDVWVNDKKLTRGSKKLIKEEGEKPSLNDVIDTEYASILEEKVEEVI